MYERVSTGKCNLGSVLGGGRQAYFVHWYFVLPCRHLGFQRLIHWYLIFIDTSFWLAVTVMWFYRDSKQIITSIYTFKEARKFASTLLIFYLPSFGFAEIRSAPSFRQRSIVPVHLAFEALCVNSDEMLNWLTYVKICSYLHLVECTLHSGYLSCVYGTLH